MSVPTIVTIPNNLIALPISNPQIPVIAPPTSLLAGKRAKCDHGKSRALCKLCGGSQICIHNRQKATCKPCGGKSICPHNKIKSRCQPCGGASLCQKHGEGTKRKSRCRECCEEKAAKSLEGPIADGESEFKFRASEFCVHKKLKSRCREGCGGKQICSHGKAKYFCKDCKAAGVGGTLLCEHDRNKYLCRTCGGSGICSHSKLKSKCLQCKKEAGIVADMDVKIPSIPALPQVSAPADTSDIVVVLPVMESVAPPAATEAVVLLPDVVAAAEPAPSESDAGKRPKRGGRSTSVNEPESDVETIPEEPGQLLKKRVRRGPGAK